jgi:hypothetical protein
MEKEQHKQSLKTFSAVALSVAFALSLQSAAKCDTEIATTQIMACGPLFTIDANADGKTAQQRAKIVQRNLDNALVASKDNKFNTVDVAFQNHNPIVVLNGFYIATADKNSAIRDGMSQQALAEKWANSIRHCLSDSSMLTKYVSFLTGENTKTTVKTAALTRTDIAVMPWGTTLPIALQNGIAVESAECGMPLKAELTMDVPLGPGFSCYLPKGTVAIGKLVDARPFNPNNFAGKGALMPYFFALQTPDGAEIPINGHILGGVNSWRAVSIEPLKPNADKRVFAERFVDVNEGVSLSGTGGSKLVAVKTEETIVSSKPYTAFRGEIAGGWRGILEDKDVQERFPRLTLRPNSLLFIPAGERMTLQLASTSTVAVNSAAAPDVSIATTQSVEAM